MSETKNTETGLVSKGDAVLGKSLIEAAQQQNRETLRNQVVGHVREFMMNLNKQRLYLESTQANIALLEEKLAALEAGAFTVATYGQITFTDPVLNKATTSMAECVNCGYSARGLQPPEAYYGPDSNDIRTQRRR